MKNMEDELLMATLLEVVGVVAILFGVIELGEANPLSPEVLIPAGSAFIAVGSILWAKVFRR